MVTRNFQFDFVFQNMCQAQLHYIYMNSNKINNLYLPSAVFITQVLVGPSKQLKQIIQIQHNIIRIPTGQKQTSLLFTSMAEDLNSELPRNKSR